MIENDPNVEAQTPNPSRRARSEPPIIDLAAAEVKPDESASGEEKSETVEGGKKFDPSLIIAAIGGGIIGGALVAGSLTFWPMKNTAPDATIALQSSISQLASQSSVKTLETRLAKIETDAGDLRKSLTQSSKASVDLTPLTTRLNTIEEALGHMEGQFSSSDGTWSKGAIRLTLAGLIKDHIAKSTPYKTEYDALIELMGPSAENKVLHDHAQSGTISYEALQHELKQIMAMPTRIETTTSSSSAAIEDRMLDVLSHFVTITRTDEAMPSAPSNSSEIELALTNHAGAKAFEIWQSMPEADRQILANWAAKLRAKLDTEAAVDTLISDALNSLSVKGAAQ